MQQNAPFDIFAASYDQIFSESITWQEQRKVSRDYLLKLLTNKNNLQILEINCGTGDDAIWLSSLGHRVTATDQSPEMIRVATGKADMGNNNLHFLTCGFEELYKTFNGKKFDLIFSNFAGLNCSSPEQLKALGVQFSALLNDNGHLAVVIFGKYTLWETIYYLFKGDRRNAFRRWKRKPVTAHLAEEVYTPVYYYSVSRFARFMRPLHIVKKKPVGLFVPPSYMELAMQKRPRFYQLLVRLEKMAMKLGGCAFSDHTYILFKKDAS